MLETPPLIPDIAETCFEHSAVCAIIHTEVRSMALALGLKLRSLALLVVLVQELEQVSPRRVSIRLVLPLALRLSDFRIFSCT